MLRSAACALLLLCTLPAQIHLNLRVEAAGQGTVLAAPGTNLAYQVIGELSGGASEGLALFGFDLGFSGGPLPQADAPTGAPMDRFAPPLGVSNPAGFGGTVQGGSLVQVGGGQNTFQNIFAPVPIGAVATGVAVPGSPAVLVSGTLTVPSAPGAYTLVVSNLFGNVIRAGETGASIWKVDPFLPGNLTHLSILVEPLRSATTTASISPPGTQFLDLQVGPLNAGRPYWTLGSLSGTSPGLSILPTGTYLPLNEDFYMHHLIANPNAGPVFNQVGSTDASGSAVITVQVPSGLPPSVIGLVVHHAVVLIHPVDFATNAVSLTLVP
jgi:hypothetical protein